MAFGAWFRVDDATLLLTARAVRNASPAIVPRSSGCRFPQNMEPPDPIDVSLLGPDAEAQPPNDVADLIEQPGLAPSRGGSEACPCHVSLR